MNRPPRDLLLSRHARADSRLDSLRRVALAEAAPVPARDLLRALFQPQRRLWLGLGVVWLVMLALQVAQPSGPRVDSRTLDHAARIHASGQAQLYALLATTAASP
jgi:hypothetical protein